MILMKDSQVNEEIRELIEEIKSCDPGSIFESIDVKKGKFKTITKVKDRLFKLNIGNNIIII
jgi:hypothetical protein